MVEPTILRAIGISKIFMTPMPEDECNSHDKFLIGPSQMYDVMPKRIGGEGGINNRRNLEGHREKEISRGTQRTHSIGQ